MGLSCGYISASCGALLFQHHVNSLSEIWLNSNIDKCFSPNVKLLNAILNIESSDAQLLESSQVLRLTSYLSDDPNLSWFNTVDINMMKNHISCDFKELKLTSNKPCQWAIFSINDAQLTDNERLAVANAGEYVGNHWLTLDIEI